MRSFLLKVTKISVLSAISFLFIPYFVFAPITIPQAIDQKEVIVENTFTNNDSKEQISISTDKTLSIVNSSSVTNLSLAITSLFPTNLEALKSYLLLIDEKNPLAQKTKKIAEILKYKKEVLGAEQPFRVEMTGGCPDIDFIDLRGVPGYPQINDLTKCGASDTLSMMIFTGDPGDIKGFEFEIDFPDGIEYGGWEYTQLGNTSIAAADPDPKRPTFLVNGITGDSLVIVNIAVRSNCDVDKTESLFFDYKYAFVYIDTSNVIHKCNGSYTPPVEFNGAVQEPVLNMLSPLSPVDVNISSIGGPGCQTVQISQDGLSTYVDSFTFEILGLEVFGADIAIDAINVNSISYPLGNLNYNTSTQNTTFLIDGTYFSSNSNPEPADNQFNTNELLTVEICYRVDRCPIEIDFPFNYNVWYGCDEEKCQNSGQTSFVKIQPLGSLPAVAIATLDADGIEICGDPGEVSITLSNPNADTDQNTFTDIQIGFQTCDKPNLAVTNVVVGGVILPRSYYTWIGDDINIDFTENTDSNLGLIDSDNDGFYDDMLGGASINAVVEMGIDCGVTSDECIPMECNDIQFYVDYKTNCGTPYKQFPDPNTFDIFYAADSVYNLNQDTLNTAGTVFGYNFGAVSNIGDPIPGTNGDTLEVEFCYDFKKQNIADCPSGANDYLQVDFIGAAAVILDVQFVTGSGMVSTDGGANYVAAAGESWTKSSDTDAQLIIEQVSTSDNVCFKYSMAMDSCLCAPIQYFVANQKVVSTCSDCTPDCSIVKACRETTFAVDQNCTDCVCIIDHGIARSERKNLGYTDKTMTTMHTRESLIDSGRAVDLGRFLPGDTLVHEEFFVILNEDVLKDVSYWTYIWYYYPIGLGQGDMARLPLTPDFAASSLTQYAVSKDGVGIKDDVNIGALISCNNSNTPPYQGYRNYWNSDPWNTSNKFESRNSVPDYWDNQFMYMHLFNYDKIDECGGTEGIRAEGNCLDDIINTYNIEVGDTIWLSFEVPMIKNPQREALKAFGQEPALQNNARIITYKYAYQLDNIAGNSSHCATLLGTACREELPLFLDCPGDPQARTEMTLTDCGGTVTHEFWIGDLPGEIGDPWFTEEYRPLVEIFDVDGLIRAPLAYCANGQAEHLGITYPLTADSTTNMFCASVSGYSDEVCAVESGNSGRVTFNLNKLGIPALGYGDGNCDTIRLSYDLCMICPSDIQGILAYDLIYDWRYAGGHNYSEEDDYLCNPIHATNAAAEGASICDELGLGNGPNWFKEMMFYDTLMGSNDVVVPTFVLYDNRTPTVPISISNEGPNLLASGAPGVSVEIQEMEICNNDPTNGATGVGGSVTVPSSIKFVDAYTDVAGTNALTSSLISDDGIHKKYNITLPSDLLGTTECITIYVGTTLLYCPSVTEAVPQVCVGAYGGCAPEVIKAALSASEGCSGSEVCYVYIFGEVGLQSEWYDLPASTPLCDTTIFKSRIKNVKQLVLLDLVPKFELLPGIVTVPGSWEVAYPGGPKTFGAWTPVDDPDIVSGNTYSYSDDALWSSAIHTDGLQGVSANNIEADSNKVAFRFKVYTECDEFLSGGKLYKEATATDPCSDQVVTSGFTESISIIIDGASPVEFAQLLQISEPDELICESLTNTFGITVINSGNKSTSDSVRMCLTIPEELTYTSGSITYTSPSDFTASNVITRVIGTDTEVCFDAPSLGAYGSYSVSFEAIMDKDTECGSIKIGSDIKSVVEMVTCSPGPPNECSAFVQNSLNPTVSVELKPPFAADDLVVYTECGSTAGTVGLYYEYTINHIGPTASNQTYTVNFYEDVDGNQSVNSNVDNLLGSDTGIFSVNTGAAIQINGSIDIAAEQSCPVLFEVVYGTECTCDREEEYFDKIPLRALRDYKEPITMCPGSCVNIEVCDYVEVAADSVKGSTGVVYELEMIGKHSTLPTGGGFVTYHTLTNNSIHPADSNWISAAEHTAQRDFYLVAHYPYPVTVSSLFIGGGQLTGWTYNLQQYTSSAYTLEYSHDGVNWTNSGLSFTGPDGDFIQEEVLPTPIGAQHWRMTNSVTSGWWTTSEFRLEGEPLPFSTAPPVSRTDNTVSICIPEGVGIDRPWEVEFSTGTGDCGVTETLEIWGLANPGITLEGDTVVCTDQCVDMEIIVPNAAIAGMTVNWTPAILIDDPTAFRVEACNITSNTIFTATIDYNDGACQEVIEWPITYFPENDISVTGYDLDCYLLANPPVITADTGWDLYNWYQIVSGTPFIAYSSTTNTFIPQPGATYYLQATRTGTICPAVSNTFTVTNKTCTDLGDLPDAGIGTSNVNYETLLSNNGPSHVIIEGLYLGPDVDEEPDGQPSTNALGDGADENVTTFISSLNISPNSSFILPLSVTNTTGNTAHLEAWIDWNGDGDFSDTNEIILDINDASSLGVFPTSLTINVPSNAATNTVLGVRFRLSNTDNMTPYGPATAGEIEDYLIQMTCKKDVCLPTTVTIKRGGQ